MKLLTVIMIAGTLPICVSAQRKPVKRSHPQTSPADSSVVVTPARMPVVEPTDTAASFDDIAIAAVSDTIVTDTDSVNIRHTKAERYDVWEERDVEFNPDPTRAVWMSALFPGLGQIYNRRYWKLPIIVGGYMGLAYATSWNNGMLADYTRAYRDIMDSDPSSNSYMDFFPPTTKEEDLDKTWLTNLLQSRKNYFRRNRDLCIICMVGVYLLAMVDAYVDASLSHFDVSPDLSIDLSPTLIQDGRGLRPSIGIYWAINF